MTVKNLSISNKKADGTYENESWTGRFVGAAKALVDTLPEKSRIKIITGQAYPGYDKEKKLSYPYILVSKAEKLEPAGGATAASTKPAEADDLPEVDW